MSRSTSQLPSPLMPPPKDKRPSKARRSKGKGRTESGKRDMPPPRSAPPPKAEVVLSTEYKENDDDRDEVGVGLRGSQVWSHDEEEEELPSLRKEQEVLSYQSRDKPVIITSPSESKESLDAFLYFVQAIPLKPKAVYRCILKRTKSTLRGSSFSFGLEGSHNAILAKKKSMPSSFLISLSKDDFKQSERTRRSKYYLGKVKVKNSKEFVQHDRGINPNRLVNFGEGDNEEEDDEGKEVMTSEEKEADELLDALIKPRIELSSVLYLEDNNADIMINIGVPKVFGEHVTVWQGTTREEKLLHNLRAVIERGSRNTLMRDQLLVLSDYEVRDRVFLDDQ